MSALWSSLLEGFPLAASSAGAVLSDLSAEAAAATIASPLTGHGVLTITGPDASKFLQGQTSTDFREVSDSESRLGCYVNLKGRAIASFRAVQQGEAIHLVMEAGLLPVVRDKLAKFIVFSRAQVQINSNTALIGVAGENAAALLTTLLPLPTDTDAVSHGEGISLVRLHGEQRWLLLVNAGRLPAVWTTLTTQATPAGENVWRLRQIGAGVAEVSLASSELFQPQELNYPLLKGVSYTKGCYTGQEIVARLHFRGKLKQHVQRFRVATGTLPAPGTALFGESGRPAGDVVLVAQADANTLELLAIARPDQAAALHLGEATGPLLHVLPLPYGVPSTE